MLHEASLFSVVIFVSKHVRERRGAPLVLAPDPGASEGPGGPGPAHGRRREPGGEHQRQVHVRAGAAPGCCQCQCRGHTGDIRQTRALMMAVPGLDKDIKPAAMHAPMTHFCDNPKFPLILPYTCSSF